MRLIFVDRVALRRRSTSVKSSFTNFPSGVYSFGKEQGTQHNQICVIREIFAEFGYEYGTKLA
jgi:hypothetical protein